MKSLLSLASAALNRPAHKRRSRATAQPSEALEDRVLLSNVTINFQNGDLKITGDSADNTVRVTQNANAIAIEGLQGTTVNGSQAMVIITPRVPDDVMVSFTAGGNNTLLMQDMEVGDDVQVKGGRQQDHIAFINGEIGDDVRVKTGNGNDIFYLESTDVEDSVNVNTGSGNDKVAIGGNGMQVDELLVNTGRGRDSVIAGDMEVRANAQFKTGSGNDFVVLSELETNGDLLVSLSGGNDDLYAVELDIQGDTDVKGGSGSDNAAETNSTFGATPTLNSIEGFLVNNATNRAADLAFCIFDEFANL